MLHKITELCKANGTSRYKLCQEIGVKYESMIKWDRHAPNVYSVYKVAKALGVTVEDLIEG